MTLWIAGDMELYDILMIVTRPPDVHKVLLIVWVIFL